MSATTAVRVRWISAAWAPLFCSVVWLLGTFGLFWLGGFSDRVPDAALLCGFVLAAVGAFAIGYGSRIRRYPRTMLVRNDLPPEPGRANALVMWSACYYIALAVALLGEYGATGPGSIWESLRHPGLAYLNKFEVYRIQQETGRVSMPIQALTLAGVLYTVLIPFLAIYWRRLSTPVRTLGVIGINTYAAFYIYIGTLKGLGDIIIMLGASLLIAAANSWWTASGQRCRRVQFLLVAAVIGSVFTFYMASSQAARIAEFKTQSRFPTNPVVAEIFGEELATGMSAVAFYPTHGYLGLAYNLQSPFVWTEGLGNSPAIASYAEQYFGMDWAQSNTYPARTQTLSGWPAGMYWSTIYPWLASDLTFPGTILFMGLLGWLFARVWVEAAFLRRKISMLVFVQIGLVIAYAPANNQLALSRLSLIGVVTLLGLYALDRMAERRRNPSPQRTSLTRTTYGRPAPSSMQSSVAAGRIGNN
jgi:hypothetical protein